MSKIKANNRQNISSGSEWEDVVGYSRALRIGDIIEVSGTTASEGSRVIGQNDFYEQTRYIITKIEKALIEAGSRLEDVVRTRIFVTDITKWQEVGRAHAEFFKTTRPAATMVEVKALISPELLVEMEVTAIINRQ